MSKIARVKFIRDKEPNIKALTAENKVLDGALYVATDTGTLWMGISSSSLIQIKDNINTNTTYTLTKSGGTITLKGSDGSSVNVTDSNTHYTTRIVAGAANGTANAATINGNTHINVTDDNTFRSGVVIKGTGATSVTSDANGNITVHSTDTDTWRPIQNNLTSTATDQSLSAAQGKALNDKFSSYVPTSRTVNNKALSSNITLSAGDVGAASANHSHDDRYYTESEIDTKLNAKAANDIIIISSTQPTSDTCKIWIKI